MVRSIHYRRSFCHLQVLLGLYFGEATPGSTYGTAGTIVLVLLWVSYSCLILFFGAQFTYVYAKTYHIFFVPYNELEK